MGKNNKARRAAKAKAKARHQRRSPGQHRADDAPLDRWPQDPQPLSEHDRVSMLWESVAHSAARTEPFEQQLNRLAEHSAGIVGRDAERLLADLVMAAWSGGWQPAELARQAKRATSTRAAARLIELAIAVDHADYDDDMLDPRWRSQIDALDLPAVPRRSGWSPAMLGEIPERRDQVAVFADAISCLAQIPRLDVLIPPPGADPAATWPPGGGYAAPAAGDADPMIERVRNLLSKAESTPFEAEAMAFTAKAHELMTRHAIDRAALAAGRARDLADRPAATRVFVDAPYADAKSLLLQIIASETRCRSVFHTGLDLSTVVGFADDLEAVQLLFTSLLVQAQSALNTAARSAPPGTRTRSQSFRSAFYLAFSNRIGERLDEANRLTTDAATAELGDAFLPVLADRNRNVDEVFEARFDSTTSGRIRGGWDNAGWATGTLAADQAQLHFADLTDNDNPVDLTDPPGPDPTKALPSETRA